MRVTMWGTRGSVPTPGPETVRYGGNTACVELRGADPESVVVLDAGTGIVRLGSSLDGAVRRVDVLLSHLHMDHILGLGFFAALFRPGLEVHLWGPASETMDLRERLGRYLSPPLFPVRVRELACNLELHDVPLATFSLPGFDVTADLVCHPGPTVGFRITDGSGVLAYVPDHEPALGRRTLPDHPDWISGYDLMRDADLLVHDAQYDDDEYDERVGWGHSTISHALAIAEVARVRHLVAFHHDPTHDDDSMDRLYADARAGRVPFELSVAREGATFLVEADEAPGAARERAAGGSG